MPEITREELVEKLAEMANVTEEEMKEYPRVLCTCSQDDI